MQGALTCVVGHFLSPETAEKCAQTENNDNHADDDHQIGGWQPARGQRGEGGGKDTTDDKTRDDRPQRDADCDDERCRDSGRDEKLRR